MAPREYPIPETQPGYEDLQHLNPAYRGTGGSECSFLDEIDPRALSDINDIFYRNGANEEPEAARSHPEICRNIRRFMISLVFRTNQMRASRYWAAHRAGMAEDFIVSPRILLKTIQEILCDPADCMIPEKSGPDWVPPTREEIDAVIIDPRRLTDTLLRNLGLDRFVPPKGIRAENSLALRAQAIPEIKDMMRSLEPIMETGSPGQRGQEMNYFRLTRMTKGTGNGFILGTRHINEKKIFFRTDIFGAERLTMHEEISMMNEIKTLKDIEYDLRVVHEGLGDWMQIKNTERVDELRAKLLANAETLEFVLVPEKRALKDNIKDCLTFKDSRRQTNPGAIRAKMLKAFEYIGQRIGAIEEMHGFIAWDQAKVVQMICDQNNPLQEFQAQIEEMEGRLKVLTAGVEKPLEPEDRARIIANLRIRRREAEKLSFEPFLSLGENFCAQIDSTIAEIEAGNDANAKREFIKIYLVAKLGSGYMAIMRLLRRISLNADNIDPSVLLAEVELAHEDFKRHKVAEGTGVDDYYRAFGEMHHLFNGLKKSLREIDVPEKKAEKFAEMKGRIKAFDFVGLIKGLTPAPPHPHIPPPEPLPPRLEPEFDRRFPPS